MSGEDLTDSSSTVSTQAGRRLRLGVRVLCFAGAVLCLLGVGGRDGLLAVVPAMSSFVSVVSIVAGRAFGAILAVGVVCGVVGLVWHRWFCRWVCPVGLCLDGASCVGKGLKRKPSQGMSVGRWLWAMGVGGALVGYPLFLWLDPMAVFAGVFVLWEGVAVGYVSLAFILLLMVLSVVRPYVWCRGVCPLGAFQDGLSVAGRRLRRRGAGSGADSGVRIGRRTVLGIVAGVVCAGFVRLAGGKGLRLLRPPGAVDEGTFEGLCSRCGNCVRSCPYGIIGRDTGQGSVLGLLTPVLSFEEDYCREDCVRCTEVCPTGALSRVDVADKGDVEIGLARVDMKICLLGEDRECAACMRWCPYGAVRYVFSEAEYTLVPVIDSEKCNGCGACEAACPTDPAKAIRVS